MTIYKPITLIDFNSISTLSEYFMPIFKITFFSFFLKIFLRGPIKY